MQLLTHSNERGGILIASGAQNSLMCTSSLPMVGQFFLALTNEWMRIDYCLCLAAHGCNLQIMA